jgi:protein-L-isoaspartate(D-aspartate) O-methyltransferase
VVYGILLYMDLEDCRRFYAEEIRFAAHLNSSALIQAFATVPREQFLGSGPWELGAPEMRTMSGLGSIKMSYTRVDDPRQVYHNVVVALDKENDINNGQPSSLACWIDALDLKPGARVYHLGCGVGYYTAIIAETVGVEGTVVGSEVNPRLAERARQNLASYPNVSVHAGDGAEFDPGVCDAIFINAGVTHPLPLWLDRQREDGRLVFPLTMSIGPNRGAGFMTKIVREHDHFSAQVVSAVAIYSCTSARDPKREPLLKASLSNGALLRMKSLRRDPHEAAETCLVHGSEVCISATELS